MTEQGQDPDARLEHSAGELQDDIERLEDHIGEAKDHLADRREEAQGPDGAEEVAGDWEDEAPERPMGDDPDGAAEESS